MHTTRLNSDRLQIYLFKSTNSVLNSHPFKNHTNSQVLVFFSRPHRTIHATHRTEIWKVPNIIQKHSVLNSYLFKNKHFSFCSKSTLTRIVYFVIQPIFTL